jgi:SAM-dependent MidA family methyltransferase
MSAPSISPEFLTVFRAHADVTGAMPFAQFMHLALYHPKVGYYRQDRERVGYGEGTDFYTASTSGPLFGELVAAACSGLLRANGRDPAVHTFVEIGAERNRGVLAGVIHSFAASRIIQIGEAIELTGDCVVFSNELLDAQPCNRTVFRDGHWRQLGVRLEGNTLVEVEVGEAPFPDSPRDIPDGYHFDRAEAAVALTEKVAAAAWRGLFVAFDYGKTLGQLLEETPAGTARAYFRHTQSNALLANPGEQDLTCHVCWDWLENALTRHGLAPTALVSQESFFIRNAGDFIATVSAAEAARFSKRKLALLQLLHPAHLGQKFQVLHALR